MKKNFFVVLIFLAFCYAAEARTVKGRVHCGTENIGGVIVTDGVNFSRTSARGKFKLDIADEAEFVYIVTPSGYSAPFSSGSPEFYRKAEGEDTFDFDLVSLGDGDYTIFAISDPQTKHDRHFAKFCAAPLQDIKANAPKYLRTGPLVGIMLGDICWDDTPMLAKYKKEAASLGFPVYAVIGNHDYNRKVPFGHYADDFKSYFGPLDYAFFAGDDLVIGLNNILYSEDGKYIEGYGEEELTFVRNLLKLVPEDAHVLVAHHSPIAKRGREKNTFIKSGDTLVALFGDRKVDMISGHTHIMNNLKISDSIVDHNIGSICGDWWSSDWCKDGTPSGYAIFSIGKDGVTHFYRSIGEPDDYQVEIIEPGESQHHPEAVVANIWDYEDGWTVSWFEDGKPMGAMTQTEDVSPTTIRKIGETYPDSSKVPRYKRPRTNNHYFMAVPDEGVKEVKIVVTSKNGEKWEFNVGL